ncbi:polyprenyl synthetase family protein [Bifidobacterium gallicum]|uniref:Polyprenyl synthetase n=1 Tax=Bifidobacterium gallicum DSM 20093 = LMG 11596 TaxID=561180 RepID=D1NT78_9BIFI|nr:polyprenyl synthetase family protein [Bifidobacterium gallicum]EFA23880.1 polyprenyl synthetase [Bifidobacterium gallicum DSM 20093 = LMG 11596]KFI59136.1 serralysin [Bifidobacterium gallicum DSM 20093 = LMG 11596]
MSATIIESDLALIEQRIGELVRSHMDVQLNSYANDTNPTACANVIASSLEPMLNAVARQAVISSEGGKRLRALLLLETYRVMEPTQPTPASDQTPTNQARIKQSVLDLACAIELFQTAALVHDDIIDDADLRRGKPAAHRALANAGGTLSTGIGLGIMLGDLLATACSVVASEASHALPDPNAIERAFMRMQQEVEIGQVLDLAIERMSLDDAQALADASLNVFRWKTASYTTITPLLLAMLAAGMPEDEALRHAIDIGLPLGIAFQIADDLIDVTGSTSNTGKPIGGDIREGKRTVLLADALDLAGTPEREQLTQYFEAAQRDADDVNDIIGMFHATGAITASERRINELWAQCQQAITALALDTPVQRRLMDMCARFIPQHLR